jgi:hypothetical protein
MTKGQRAMIAAKICFLKKQSLSGSGEKRRHISKGARAMVAAKVCVY